MKVFKIASHHLINLLEAKKLPIRYSIEPKRPYVFYAEKYLYGLYQLKTSTKYFHYFKTNSFKPLKIISPTILHEGNAQKIINIFLAENQIKNRLYLKIIKKNDALFILYLNKKNPQLFSQYKITLQEEDEKIIKQINEMIAGENNQNFLPLKKLGRELFQRIANKKLTTILEHANQIALVVPEEINVLPLNGNDNFYFIKNVTLFHHHTSNKKMLRQITSLQITSSLEDRFMIEEIKTIENVLEKKCRRPYSILKKPTKKNFLNELTRKDFLHLIYHGAQENESFQLLEGGKVFLTARELYEHNAPRVLFLATCFSKNKNLIDWFFKCGGQTLIVCQGKLFSKNLPRAWFLFYWWLFYKKVDVRTAFFKMIAKLHFLNDLNVFKFHLYGYGKEKI